MVTLKKVGKVVVVLFAVGALVSACQLVVAPEQTANDLLHLGVHDDASINEIRGFLGGILVAQAAMILLGVFGTQSGRYFYLVSAAMCSLLPVALRLLDFVMTPVVQSELRPVIAEFVMGAITLLYARATKSDSPP